MPIIVPRLSDWNTLAIPKSIRVTLVLGRDDDVRRLHVAKDDRLRLVAVQVFHYVTDLQGDIDNFFFEHWPAAHLKLGLQVVAVDIFKHKVDAAIGREEVVNLGDAGVRQGGEQRCFALEVSQAYLARARIGEESGISLIAQ